MVSAAALYLRYKSYSMAMLDRWLDRLMNDEQTLYLPIHSPLLPRQCSRCSRTPRIPLMSERLTEQAKILEFSVPYRDPGSPRRMS